MKRNVPSPITALSLATLLLMLILAGRALAAGPRIKILHSFQGGDGAYPLGSLIFDAAGNLYGTAPEGAAPAQNGVVFQLQPPAHNQSRWRQTTIATFAGSDGANPYAALISDRSGNLYGTTDFGGAFNCGTVFQLTPPATPGAAWTKTVLYDFPGGRRGSSPYGGLAMDRKGNLYGTTFWGGDDCQEFGLPCGVVFELRRPTAKGKGWIESVIYRFKSVRDGYWPFAGLVIDENGNLYGTTIDGGEYGTSRSAWRSVHNFVIPAPFIPIMDGPDGTVFELTPPPDGTGEWTKTILHSFGQPYDGANPYSALIRDQHGNLYGTTYFGGTSTNCGFVGESCGTVFRLSPPHKKGGSWTETILSSFASGSSGGAGPYAGVAFDRYGNLYGTTNFGGTTISGICNYGCGVVFKLTPAGKGEAWTETVLHRFVNSSDGAYPVAGVVLCPKGNLWGTTEFGGASGLGTTFEIIP